MCRDLGWVFNVSNENLTAPDGLDLGVETQDGSTDAQGQIDSDLTLRVGREACKLVKTADIGARMLTVSSELSFGVQPAKPGTGRTPLPSAFYNQAIGFDIWANCASSARHII
ncbi:MAG: hypothetical protein KJP02_12525 [Octadecabacter sp.]|nr:hypothetical protein [Octadecabacter sp.]